MSTPPGRTTYTLLAAASALFLVYGSLVPFTFESITWAEALARFSDALSWPPLVDSRADFVTNILIAGPPAYFGMAALCSDRSWRIRSVASLVVLAACLALAVLVEFAQVFFPVRTDSLSDVVAQAIGAVGGVGAWLLIGEAVTRWVRTTLAEREPPAFLQRLLLVYIVLYVVSQMMPMDLTINLHQLAGKYRDGGVRIVPFTFQYISIFDAAWDLVGTLVLSAPLGAAAVLIGTRRQHRRGTLVACGLVVAAVGLIECAQVFVMSRIADSTDVLMGAIGGIVGAIVTARASARPARAPRVESAGRALSLGWEAVFVWALALITYHWSPFDFTVNASRVNDGVHALLSVPFRTYYSGDQYHAFNEILRKGLLGVPLGIAFAFALSRRVANFGLRLGASTSMSFGVLLAIEAGQIFVPSRTPDITDPMVGAVGALIGFVVTDRVLALGTPRDSGIVENLDHRP